MKHPSPRLVGASGQAPGTTRWAQGSAEATAPEGLLERVFERPARKTTSALVCAPARAARPA